jgi:hypothetical protein
VLVFEQPRPPWVIPGVLPIEDAVKLERAGAVLTTSEAGLQTSIAWPGESLKEFMLFEGLIHEIAHHILQQYTGKRRMQIARTKDHEAFAEATVARVRRLLRAE